MNNYKEWNEFLRNLFSDKYKTSKEYEHQYLIKEQIYEFLSTNRRTEVVYHLRLKDCGWLLKNLRVLV